MTEESLDEIGPVDYVIVEFPAGAANFTGEMARELLTLVETHRLRMHPAMPFAEAILEEMRQYVREHSATTGRVTSCSTPSASTTTAACRASTGPSPQGSRSTSSPMLDRALQPSPGIRRPAR